MMKQIIEKIKAFHPLGSYTVKNCNEYYGVEFEDCNEYYRVGFEDCRARAIELLEEAETESGGKDA